MGEKERDVIPRPILVGPGLAIHCSADSGEAHLVCHLPTIPFFSKY